MQLIRELNKEKGENLQGDILSSRERGGVGAGGDGSRRRWKRRRRHRRKWGDIPYFPAGDTLILVHNFGPNLEQFVVVYTTIITSKFNCG